MRKLQIVAGSVFGHLTVMSEYGVSAHGHKMYKCVCDCGVEKIISGSHMANGDTKSCGCKRSHSTHLKSKSTEYTIWKQMKQRCDNPKAPSFHRYGGRGITICKDWYVFENFYRDMGDRPGNKYFLERTNNNDGYSKENCRWSTMLEQCHNRGMYSSNTSGETGVYWNKKLSKWEVKICSNYQKTHIGVFKTFNEAVTARKTAQSKLW